MNKLITSFRNSPAQYFVLIGALLVLVFFAILPFVKLFSVVLFSEGSFNFAVFSELLSNESFKTALGNTLLVCTGVTILSLLLGIPAAWLISRTNLIGARKWRSWLSIPYAIPPYIGAIAWIYLANPTTGLLNNILGAKAFNIYSLGGLIWVETCFLYTFILLVTLNSLDRMDSSYEEAARLSGANPLRVFQGITLPLIKPALLSGSVLVFLATAASFGVPALIGTPARLFLVTTQIYTFQKMGSTNGLIKAGALSCLLLVLTLLALSLNAFLDRKAKFQTVSGKTSRPSLIDLNQFQKWAQIYLALLVFAVFILPLGGVFISSLSAIQGEFSFNNLTIQNYIRTLFEVDETPRAFANSIVFSAIAAVIACALGLVLAYLKTKTKLPGRSLVDWFSTIPYATPGTVVSLALILSFSQGFYGYGPSLYNTMWMIIIAYAIKYLSFAVKTNSDGFQLFDDVLAEAARVSGANWSQTMKTIWLPLMKPSLVAAFFLILMPMVSELTMTVLLTGPGLETIGTLIFQLQEYADASGAGASVLAMLVVVFVILTNLLVKRLSQGRYGL